ncbi:MAG: AMP-binding protein, partial [Mucinivorans sp.]
MFESSFREHWEQPALSDYFKNETLTYGDVAVRIAKIHILFRAMDVRAGDKIAIIGRNNIRWCVAFLATITYGAVVVPILQEFNANDVQHIITHSDSVLLFASDVNFEAIELSQISSLRASFSLTDLSTQYVSENFERRISLCDVESKFEKQYYKGFTAKDIKYHHTPSNQMVLLSYTSGTTGFSKGVMVSGNNLVGNMPAVMGIKQILNEWIIFRKSCVFRKISYELARKKDKLHLLKGLSKILLDID